MEKAFAFSICPQRPPPWVRQDQVQRLRKSPLFRRELRRQHATKRAHVAPLEIVRPTRLRNLTISRVGQHFGIHTQFLQRRRNHQVRAVETTPSKVIPQFQL
jgi:hypothetical protein